jgi:hypothetical protein
VAEVVAAVVLKKKNHSILKADHKKVLRA